MSYRTSAIVSCIKKEKITSILIEEKGYKHIVKINKLLDRGKVVLINYKNLKVNKIVIVLNWQQSLSLSNKIFIHILNLRQVLRVKQGTQVKHDNHWITHFKDVDKNEKNKDEKN